MYGWRARIASITATPTEHFTCEFYKLAPPGVVCVPACVFVDKVVKEELAQQQQELLRVVKGLLMAEVDYIIVGGAPMIFMAGIGEDKRLLAEIKKLTPIPATTDITCTMESFERLGVKKIAIATPLRDAINQKLKAYLEDAGYQVLVVKALEILRNVDITRLPLEASYKLAKEAHMAAPDAEAIYMPCAVWPSLENIDAMESDFGIPVITNFASKYWAAMNTLKIKQTVKGYGKLLETLGE
jgi:maleate cis-trans isomerase